jgi:hypothetical protein
LHDPVRGELSQAHLLDQLHAAGMASQAGWLTFRCTVRQLVLERPLRLPPNVRDVTAERVGTMVAIVGATGAEKANPK